MYVRAFSYGIFFDLPYLLRVASLEVLAFLGKAKAKEARHKKGNLMKKALKILSAGLLLSTLGMVTIACGGGSNEPAKSSDSGGTHQDADVTSINITPSGSNIIALGATLEMNITTAPDNDPANVVLTSSNTEVATVAGKTVTATGYGYTKITATYKEASASCLVFVTEHAGEKGTISWKSNLDHNHIMISVGDSFDINDYIKSVSPSLDAIGIASGEDAISLEGSVVTATDVGSFSITIVAGKLKGNLSGKVVSEDFGDFAELAEQTGVNYNYTAYSDMAGLIVSNENTLLVLDGDSYDEETKRFSLNGIVYGQDGEGADIQAPVTLGGQETEDGFVYDDEFVLGHGIPATRDAMNIKGWNLSLYDWEEVAFEDEDENLIPAWVFAENKAGELEGLYDSIFGVEASPWYYFQTYGKAEGAVAMLSGENGLMLIPYKTVEGEIELIDEVELSSGSSYGAIAYIDDIGQVNLAATTAWLADPQFAEPLDTSLMASFFHNLGEVSNYTVTYKGGWEKGESPAGWYYGTDKEVLVTYEVEERFTPTADLVTYNNVKSTATLPLQGFPLASDYGFTTGAKNLYFVDAARGVFSASNLGDDYTVGENFSEPKAVTSDDIPLVYEEGEDFSDKAMNTFLRMSPDFGKDGEKTYDYVANASWTKSEDSEDGNSLVYSYNFNGEDCTKVVDSDNSLYGVWGMFLKGETLTAMCTGWRYYIQDWAIPGSTVLEVEVSVAKDLSSCTFHMVLPMSATAEYGTTVTISNVGSTVMTEEAQALIDAHNAELE